MKTNENKHQNITLSLPAHLISDLKRMIGRGEMSRFVAEAVTMRLQEQMSALRQAYQEAGKDKARNREAKEWDHLAGEGLPNEEDW